MPLPTRPYSAHRSLRWFGLILFLSLVTAFLLVPKYNSLAQQASGYEGDVMPRPNGKKAAPGLPDAVQIGRFATGLDAAAAGSEWQRADIAPRATLGDGSIGISDVVQALRYVTGLDPLTAAGGPTASAKKPAFTVTAAQPEAAREIRVGTPVIGVDAVTLPILLESQGDENALSFSLAFDPALLSNPSVVLGDDAPAQTLLLLNPNEVAGGHFGIGMALPAGVTFSAGTRQVLRVSFNLAPAAFGKTTPIGFGDFPTSLEAADKNANSLPQPIFTGRQITPVFPSPTLTSLNPATVFAGDAAFTLSVTGTSFVNGAVVRWGGTDLVTTFQNATLVTAAVPAALIQAAGSVNITVINPAPNAGASNALTLNIVNPVPALTGLSATTIAAGGAAGSLDVSGNNFILGSVVRWNNVPVPTTFLSRTQLRVDYTAANIACAGLVQVTVFNPAPAGGTSNGLTLTIAPTITSINPNATFAGNGEFTLTVLGAGFCEGMKIRVDGVARTSTIVSSTQITTNISAADLSPVGTRQISVISADGVVSNNVLLTINANPTPTITSLNPASVLNGSPGFELTVNGSGFLPGSKVHWNGSERATTFVSTTQLKATIPASDVALAGVAEVTVKNPAPGGGTSAAVNFTVNGLEADVAPRPNGNGSISMADWVQLGRFFIGNDTLTLGSEFQRTDCYPTQTKGDGRLTIGDWVQAGRFAAGLDTPSTVGGPTQPVFLPPVNAPFALIEAQGRAVRVRETAFQRGQLGVLQIELDGQGNENALAFSLNFDARQMTFVDAALNNENAGATLHLNRTQSGSGRLGFAVVLTPGQQWAAGTRTLLTLRFIPNGGEGDVTTEVRFGDELVARDIVDAQATALPQTVYANGRVTIRGRAAAHVSAASYLDSELSADSIASAFGSNLASLTQSALSLPLPTTLGGTSVRIKDALGVERSAPLFFVSPSQLNYQLPAGLAEGIASVAVTNGAGEVIYGLLNIGKVAPGLFAADASGKGYAAADVVYVAQNGAQTQTSVARFDAGQNRLVGVPIDLQTNAAVLVLYGTGLRQRSALNNVKVKVGGVEALVEYVGAQNQFAGLDQLNVRLPKSLAGRGEMLVEVNVDGKAANPVKVMVK